jgi:CRP-like cAMP-binding protein
MPHRKLIARLQAVSGLTARDRAGLEAIPYVVKELEDSACVSRQGDRPKSCVVIMRGFLARQRVVAARNQICAFYVPGDMPDLPTLHLPEMDHDLCSVGRSTIAMVSHSYLKPLIANSAELANALWRETLIQGAIYRDWVENLGSRQALPRLAHLFCELATRLRIVGLVKDDTFDLPFTQEDMADATGLSIVHVNRTLQELRRRGVIELQNRSVTVLQPNALEELGEFDPAYLHGLEPPDSGRRADSIS